MITNNSIGVNVDWVHLGGGYASDAAAEAAWVAYAAHQSIYPVYQEDGVTANLPTGYAYFNTGTNRLRPCRWTGATTTAPRSRWTRAPSS